MRLATETDYPAIAAIQQESPEAAQWSVSDYAAFSILIAEAGPNPVGFCIWRQSTPDEAELLNLAVLRSHRQRGVASALLEALERKAAGDLFLEVAESNGAAIALYEHHGWVRTGVRKGYYDGGSGNAVVMHKRA